MYEHPQYTTFVFLVCSMMSRATLPVLWYNYMSEYIKKKRRFNYDSPVSLISPFLTILFLILLGDLG